MGNGPLSGLRVVELAGLGPAPHGAMQLADLGADVVRVDRPTPSESEQLVGSYGDHHTLRGRRSVVADLKDPDELERVRTLVDHADVLIEGFRPGVAERLGLGPDRCLDRNPRLLYARVTGWGQDGPLAQTAGHDITYLARTGVLHGLGRPPDPPLPPMNLLADYGGGSMLLLVGVLAALQERHTSGRGQVIDVAMVDGIGVLTQPLWSMRAAGGWSDHRFDNLLDGAAPFYTTYRCADDRYLAVGAVETPFFEAFVRTLGIDPDTLPPRFDRGAWPGLRARFAERVSTRTRDEWTRKFVTVDACVAPVLAPDEVLTDPHVLARDSMMVIDGVPQPRPAPRFSRTPLRSPAPPPPRGSHHVNDVIGEWSTT